MLACSLVPLQAFSDDDYNWWQGNLPHRAWSGYSNRTMTFGFSNETISYEFSNGTRNDDSHHGDKGPKCAPHEDGRGRHRGEKECDGADPGNGRGHAWGKLLKPGAGNPASQDIQGPITPEKNRQGLDNVIRDISSGHHPNAPPGPRHVQPKGHRGKTGFICRKTVTLPS